MQRRQGITDGPSHFCLRDEERRGQHAREEGQTGGTSGALDEAAPAWVERVSKAVAALVLVVRLVAGERRGRVGGEGWREEGRATHGSHAARERMALPLVSAGSSMVELLDGFELAAERGRAGSNEAMKLARRPTWALPTRPTLRWENEHRHSLQSHTATRHSHHRRPPSPTSTRPRSPPRRPLSRARHRPRRHTPQQQAPRQTRSSTTLRPMQPAQLKPRAAGTASCAGPEEPGSEDKAARQRAGTLRPACASPFSLSPLCPLCEAGAHGRLHERGRHRLPLPTSSQPRRGPAELHRTSERDALAQVLR